MPGTAINSGFVHLRFGAIQFGQLNEGLLVIITKKEKISAF